MTPRDFCYWLQGYCELGGQAGNLTPAQFETIKRHLRLVFATSIDPLDYGKQDALQEIHDGEGVIPTTPPHLAAQGYKVRY